MDHNAVEFDELTQAVPPHRATEEIEVQWLRAVEALRGKIVVLDDDPTGIQTVHHVPVYTSWDSEALKQALQEPSRVVYILTNSRAMTAQQSEHVHRQIARDLIGIKEETKQDFILISRGDSTLRGHYPMETQVLYEELRKFRDIDGEIVIPFFLEGGRYTYNDIHYVRDGEWLVPAGQTEFAKDSTFGYSSSDLKLWIQEKTKERYSSKEVVSISLEMLRENDVDGIAEMLLKVKGFNKIIVNALDYTDIRVFVTALQQAMSKGKQFLFRTAASFVREIGGIYAQQLLNREMLYEYREVSSQGIILVGSHVSKTSKQLEKLRELTNIKWIEFNVEEVLDDRSMEGEIGRVLQEIHTAFDGSFDVCLYTTRQYRWSVADNKQSEQNLLFSTRVSEGLVRVVQLLGIQPKFLIAKGGITSSDIGVKGLGVKRAEAIGQILPGIPVWRLGSESKFPGMPYVIFPGNVGSESALKEIAEMMRG